MIREPKNIEFEVENISLTDVEKTQISEVISHFKKTGEVKKLSAPKLKSNK